MTTATSFSVPVPVFGEVYAHYKSGNKSELVRDALRISAAVVTGVALGLFPTISAYVVAVPFVGTLIQGFANTTLLTPLTQVALLGLVSVPALSMAVGAYLVTTAVSVALQANLVLGAVAGFNLLAQLLSGIFLLGNYKVIDFGLLEMGLKHPAFDAQAPAPLVASA